MSKLLNATFFFSLFLFNLLLILDDDEITETTWVIKLGDKNVTDKDMLDFINSQINGGTLLQNNSTKLNTTSSGKCIYVDNFKCNKYVLYIYIIHSKNPDVCRLSDLEIRGFTIEIETPGFLSSTYRIVDVHY